VPVETLLIQTDGSTGPADKAAIAQALKEDKLLWLDVRGPDNDDVAALTEIFSLHPLAAEDLTEFGQRPKIEDFGNLVYLVSYGVKGTDNDLTEVHCFIADKFLMTVRRDGCHSLEEMRDRLSPKDQRLLERARPTRLILLHNILDALIDSFFPSLASFDDRIDELQEMIFSKPSNEQLAELFTMQRWLVSVRKLISPQRDAMAALVGGIVTLPGMSAESDPYLRDLYDHLIRVSDLIDSYRDLLTNAMDAYLSMVSNNLNEVMKQLAIIATIFLPLSFLTGFFGQNFAWLVNQLGGLPVFLIVGIGTELLAVFGLYWLFRHRGWISTSRPARSAAAAGDGAAAAAGDGVAAAGAAGTVAAGAANGRAAGARISPVDVPTWLTSITRNGRWHPKPAPGQQGEGHRARRR
jgi:magnesium transporter